LTGHKVEKVVAVLNAGQLLGPPNRKVIAFLITFWPTFCLASVFLDEFADAVAALAAAFGASDAQHIELAFDVTKDEVSARHWTLTAKIFPQL